MIKGGAVSKHCSILNYIRKADEELYELIQDLCIGRAFAPRRGAPGITFLRPDKSLLKDIKKLAEGENPEEAVDALQALILLDYLPSLSDFDLKKSDIPTFHRNKLPVTSADGKKVILQNGAEIIPDKDFNARSDRSNIAVHMISKALVPVDGEAADFSNAKVSKTKKGGAELVGAGLTRSELFQTVMREMYGENNNQRDAAMELLVSLYIWASSSAEHEEIAKLIASQVSHDSLASLAIILQPFKSSGKIYITDADLKNFTEYMYKDASFQKSILYTFNPNAVAIYNKLCEGNSKYQNNFKNIVDKITNVVDVSAMAPANIVSKMNNIIDNSKNILPGMRKDLTKQEIYAETELRIMSAVVLENSDGNPSLVEMQYIYENCKLDKPQYLDNKPLMFSGHISWFMSTGMLAILSGAYCYVPCSDGSSSLEDVVKADKFINISKVVECLKYTKERRNNSKNLINSVVNSMSAHAAANVDNI